MCNDIETIDFIEDDSLCERCNCCEQGWVECAYCGGGGGQDGDELMSEDPLWYSQDDFRKCDACNGNGGHYVCLGECDENGSHA